MKKLSCLLCLVLLFLMVGCNNNDPNVSNSETVSSAVSGTVSKDAEGVPDYIDADALANRSYELRYLFAQKKFDSPEEISVSALVQFVFCHLYYENLTDMPTAGNKLRTATADDIKLGIIKYFGSLDVDITKSDLYNAGRQQFEMWEPNYGTEIYYDVNIVADGENIYKAITTFYADSSKSEAQSKTVLTVEDVSGQILIRKLSSSSQE